jgi:hypothetical protein
MRKLPPAPGPNIGRMVDVGLWHVDVGLWQILLQKSFCTGDQKFSGL